MCRSYLQDGLPKLLDFHIRTGGDVTVATIEYPIALANRFGVIATDDRDRVVAFDEMPSVEYGEADAFETGQGAGEDGDLPF